MDDRTAGAAALKRLRTRRGLSLSGLAHALLDSATALHLRHMPSVASVQRNVSRWEAGTAMPDGRYQLLLAHVYARTPGGQASLGASSDLAELLHALGLFGESERQVADARTAVIRAVTDQGGAGMLALLTPGAQDTLAAAIADPSRTDDTVCEALSAAVVNVNSEVGSLPFVRLQLLLSPTVEACRRLLAGPVPVELLPRLRDTAVAASTLAGRLAFETRDDTASRALYREATRQAGELLEPWRQARVHMSHALVTLYSQDGLDQPRALVDSAVRAARSGDSVLVRARAHALQAEIAARAGLDRQTDAALGLAWYDMEADHTSDPSATSFTAGHLRGFEGVCQLWVGDPSVAHDQFSHSVAALEGRREQVQRAIVRTDQALARIRMGEPRDAAGLLHECVTAASTTGGRVPAIRLRRARRELRPWRREDWVQDLDDHLMDVLGT
ncbi:hypothetical protein [Streptomyces fractus]|uniref:hypothetical protein n=1 Tax=Streptomyces fractus TaxID=641806 RepID=UPI003CE71BAC